MAAAGFAGCRKRKISCRHTFGRHRPPERSAEGGQQERCVSFTDSPKFSTVWKMGERKRLIFPRMHQS